MAENSKAGQHKHHRRKFENASRARGLVVHPVGLEPTTF